MLTGLVRYLWSLFVFPLGQLLKEINELNNGWVEWRIMENGEVALSVAGDAMVVPNGWRMSADKKGLLVPKWDRATLVLRRSIKCYYMSGDTMEPWSGLCVPKSMLVGKKWDQEQEWRISGFRGRASWKVNEKDVLELLIRINPGATALEKCACRLILLKENVLNVPKGSRGVIGCTLNDGKLDTANGVFIVIGPGGEFFSGEVEETIVDCWGNPYLENNTI